MRPRRNVNLLLLQPNGSVQSNRAPKFITVLDINIHSSPDGNNCVELVEQGLDGCDLIGKALRCEATQNLWDILLQPAPTKDEPTEVVGSHTYDSRTLLGPMQKRLPEGNICRKGNNLTDVIWRKGKLSNHTLYQRYIPLKALGIGLSSQGPLNENTCFRCRTEYHRVSGYPITSLLCAASSRFFGRVEDAGNTETVLRNIGLKHREDTQSKDEL